ncbi:hypothetical protein L5515_015483 [Caenorhabditis briggsae]|uniref:Uncharacterized protein n=1 Tax=Caenorhabditis briggsae TaxID=6238 RepID=A0AAE9JA73_CAEBR|nr:hypothetical protein L5515_015483 [Caenorhabditis briggsae]
MPMQGKSKSSSGSSGNSSPSQKSDTLVVLNLAFVVTVWKINTNVWKIKFYANIESMERFIVANEVGCFGRHVEFSYNFLTVQPSSGINNVQPFVPPSRTTQAFLWPGPNGVAVPVLRDTFNQQQDAVRRQTEAVEAAEIEERRKEKKKENLMLLDKMKDEWRLKKGIASWEKMTKEDRLEFAKKELGLKVLEKDENEEEKKEKKEDDEDGPSTSGS